MEKDQNLLQTLSKITNISKDETLDDHHKLQNLLQTLRELIGAEKASIMFKRGNRFLEVVAATRLEIIGLRQPLSCNSPSCWVIRNKKPLYMDKDTKNPGVSFKGGYKTDAFFLAPIFSANKVMGVLSMTDKDGDGSFSLKDRETILQLAGIIISSIENNSLNDRLKKQRHQLEKKNRQLKEYEKIRQEFFNLLVHDLKAPIAEIVANLDILSYTTTEENLSFVESAQSSCNTMFRMISNLLDITRLENRMLKLIPEHLDATDLLEEALSMIHGQARMKQITLKNETKEAASPLFIGDRGLLLRVFQNLFANAIQYSPEGSTIRTGYEVRESKILFYVDDEGPGIAPEDRDKIFDKYMQVGKRDYVIQGHSTGLGLNFCRLAMQAHKGNIFMESSLSGGSSFRFTLPLIQEEKHF
ncbi:GAF domain-containing sensor histidine kinase [Desulfobotulus mexicanus]|uniref:histidine kinase n=1 Tax=Desulfobotulus mexicanus TaxID=2586642 RepID=A0A5Q4VH87_9BACT|nr:GAF domain-containing sensor histidine kinase [Desulfobotulus mexicanus]TYT75642.1 GAF domain-containing sensor histidine kinase [Desulfobotulus mexicanus]